MKPMTIGCLPSTTTVLGLLVLLNEQILALPRSSNGIPPSHTTQSATTSSTKLVASAATLPNDETNQEEWWRDPFAAFDIDDDEYDLDMEVPGVYSYSGSPSIETLDEALLEETAEEGETPAIVEGDAVTMTIEQQPKENENEKDSDEGAPVMESQQLIASPEDQSPSEATNGVPGKTKLPFPRDAGTKKSLVGAATMAMSGLANATKAISASPLTSSATTKRAVKILALLSVVKAILGPLRRRRENSEKNIEDSRADGNEEEQDNYQSEYSSDVDMDPADEYVEDINTDTIDTMTYATRRQPWRQKLGVPAWLGGRRDEENFPPARELMDRLNKCEKEAESARSERQAMEHEYERASWQLQEAQNELTTLSSTTRYLKAQLRDSQDVMTQAIKAERRKARQELDRMKEAMLSVLQKERETLRKKFMEQNAEVQALLNKDKANGGGSSSSSNRSDDKAPTVATTTPPTTTTPTATPSSTQ